MALPNHQPTLVVQGAADQVVASDHAEVLASLRPDARLQRFDGAGHLLYWGAAQAVRAYRDRPCLSSACASHSRPPAS
jgi:pimeloyl-ACP methyl ester carboxylesterase